MRSERAGKTPLEAQKDTWRTRALVQMGERSSALLDRYGHTDFGRLVVSLSFLLGLEACGGSAQISQRAAEGPFRDFGSWTVQASPDMQVILSQGMSARTGITVRAEERDDHV